MAGWAILAPIMLVILRFFQGLALGGEWSGAALLATENAPEGKRAIYGTFPQLGAPIGFIIANVIFIWMNVSLSAEEFLAWGLEGSVPAQRGPGHRGPLRPFEAGGERVLHQGDSAGKGAEAAPRGYPQEPLAPPWWPVRSSCSPPTCSSTS